jgi:hypothetical protein
MRTKAKDPFEQYHVSNRRSAAALLVTYILGAGFLCLIGLALLAVLP